jgi:glycosyltransferase involved in cell wall biosynthesis
LLRRLTAVLDALPAGPHEMVFADDGSTDDTLDLLREAAERDPRVVVVSLSRNFGHQAAITAALDSVRGETVVVMDGDLQDPPEMIPRLLAQREAGFDVVFAQRVGRREPWPLRACYYLFYRLLAALANLHLPLDAGDFAVLSRRVVDEMRGLPERNRYLRGLRSWVGYRQCGIPVERPARFAGSSKYGLWKLFRLALDGLLAFSMVPLRAAAIAGAATIGATLLYVAYAIYAKLVLHQVPQGFTALLVAVVLFGGVQLLFLGIIGEYIGRIYEETKGRPHYVVRERIGSPDKQI